MKQGKRAGRLTGCSHAVLRPNNDITSVAQQLAAEQHRLSADDLELLQEAVQQRQASEQQAHMQRAEMERQADEYEAEGAIFGMEQCPRPAGPASSASHSASVHKASATCIQRLLCHH
eukprot:1157296-Pelagomonas_calceolata.AAC.9